MKLRIMRSAWIALLFMSLSVTAQTTDKPEWSNEQVSGVNMEYGNFTGWLIRKTDHRISVNRNMM